MGHDQDGAGIVTQMMLQPIHTFGVQMVGGFVKQDEIGLGQQQPRQRDAALLTPGKIFNTCVAGWAAQRIHCLLDLRFQVP